MHGGNVIDERRAPHSTASQRVSNYQSVAVVSLNGNHFPSIIIIMIITTTLLIKNSINTVTDVSGVSAFYNMYS